MFSKNFQSSQNRNLASDQKMVPETSVLKEELRQRLPTVYHMYKFVRDKLKIELPRWEKVTKRPKWATEQYLLGIIQGRYFALEKSSVKEPVTVKKDKTKGELREILENLAGKELGIGLDYEPKKEWLIKMIYSLDQNNEIFKSAEDETRATIPEK